MRGGLIVFVVVAFSALVVQVRSVDACEVDPPDSTFGPPSGSILPPNPTIWIFDAREGLRDVRVRGARVVSKQVQKGRFDEVIRLELATADSGPVTVSVPSWNSKRVTATFEIQAQARTHDHSATAVRNVRFLSISPNSSCWQTHFELTVPYAAAYLVESAYSAEGLARGRRWRAVIAGTKYPSSERSPGALDVIVVGVCGQITGASKMACPLLVRVTRLFSDGSVSQTPTTYSRHVVPITYVRDVDWTDDDSDVAEQDSATNPWWTSIASMLFSLCGFLGVRQWFRGARVSTHNRLATWRDRSVPQVTFVIAAVLAVSRFARSSAVTNNMLWGAGIAALALIAGCALAIAHPCASVNDHSRDA